MAKETYCPIRDGECKKDECQWWLDGAQRCAVAFIPGALESIQQIIDYK
ncbi:MAG: hypothetical protein ACW975_08230 [Candidatus Thorarchaeota archaeon]|jgi:hypothetical protein